MKTTVDDCRIIELGKHHGATGNITVVENGKVIDFDIKRVFYIYDIPGGVTRGAHAHKTLRELIVAATGSFEVRVFDGEREKVFLLNHPSKALYLPCGVWEELRNFSSGSVALVLASTPHMPEDYFRDIDEFLKYRKEL
ncbi:MAG: WxcM-like domain-containing protein [Bacteroidaceae bacterium]|jgi:dTDP-4-dehydrorhamnose 3,5-epimerase-like enzyme|nr:WxcM-like domain-containing protein [Bacteroidaceae bacterium]